MSQKRPAASGSLRDMKAKVQQGSRRSSVRVSYASSLSIAWPKSTEEDGKAVIRLLKEAFAGFRRQSRAKSDAGADEREKRTTMAFRSVGRRGINQVVKALEKNELELVVVARENVPQILVAHLPFMAAARNVPICAVRCSGEELGSVLGIERMVCFGIIRDSMPHLVQDLAAFSQIPNIPWKPSSSCTYIPFTEEK